MATTLTLDHGSITSPAAARTSTARRSRLSTALWTVQGLLAAVFLFSGVAKLAMPLDVMAAQMPVLFPGWFLRFLGVAEFSGALGLLLPGLTRVKPVLTPLAAVGLAIIMAGATVITLASGAGLAALPTLVLGLLALFVAYSRSRMAPHKGR